MRSSGVSVFSENCLEILSSIAYVGSKGTHLTIERQLNQLPPLPASENPFGPNEPLDAGGLHGLPSPDRGHPGDGTTPFLFQSGTMVTPQNPAIRYLQAACTSPNIPNVNSLPRPYPGLGKSSLVAECGQFQLPRIAGHAAAARGPLTAGVSYSYSHSIDNASDRSDPVLVDSYNLRGNRASSNFDQRHLSTSAMCISFRISRDWFAARNRSNPPIRSERSATLDKMLLATGIEWILGGWELSGVTFSVGHAVHGD